MEEDVKLPVYLLDDADRLDGSAWSVQVRAYDENLHVISEAVYSGRDSANVTYLGHLPVDRADAGSGPVLLTAEVYVEGEKSGRYFLLVQLSAETGLSAGTSRNNAHL